MRASNESVQFVENCLRGCNPRPATAGLEGEVLFRPHGRCRGLLVARRERRPGERRDGSSSFFAPQCRVHFSPPGRCEPHPPRLQRLRVDGGVRQHTRLPCHNSTGAPTSERLDRRSAAVRSELSSRALSTRTTMAQGHGHKLWVRRRDAFDAGSSSAGQLPRRAFSHERRRPVGQSRSGSNAVGGIVLVRVHWWAV